MNFLKTATLVGAISIIGVSCLADEEVFDFERLKTTYGRTYQKIFVLSADTHGLMFRHDKGIAKVSFKELSMNLRMLYEPVESVPEAKTKLKNADATAGKQIATAAAPVYLTYLIQPVYQITQSMPNYCRAPAQYWPNHWPRYHPAHAYAHAPSRELVVRDFLYTTGLACKPPGVVTRRLPYRRSYLAHHRY